jgi:hypothetical protein
MPRDWRIVLNGSGGNRDGRPDDVDVLVSQLVKHLRVCGHDVKAATLQTEGNSVDLLKNPAVEARRNARAPVPALVLPMPANSRELDPPPPTALVGPLVTPVDQNEIDLLKVAFAQGLRPLDNGKHYRVDPETLEPMIVEGEAPEGLPTGPESKVEKPDPIKPAAAPGPQRKKAE